MEDAVELRVVGATRLEHGTGYVKLELGFSFSSTWASLSGLETQWKGNSASKASRSLSVKPACFLVSYFECNGSNNNRSVFLSA